MSKLTRDGTAEPVVSRDQILRRERGQGNVHFLCSADHEFDWHTLLYVMTMIAPIYKLCTGEALNYKKLNVFTLHPLKKNSCVVRLPRKPKVEAGGRHGAGLGARIGEILSMPMHREKASVTLRVGLSLVWTYCQ